MNRIKYQNLEVIMFLVFNKEKIQTYIVSVLTVAVLITIANVRKVETIQTSSQEKELPIYNVQTDEKKVAFTMNCAWNADDIDKILETLQKNNIKITFFMVGDWIEKFPEAVKKIKDAIEFSIKDTGIGISKNILEHIFDEFVTDANISNDSQKGIGLGLAICKAIIQAHGGEIEAKNDEQGACFVFTIPNEELNV